MDFDTFNHSFDNCEARYIRRAVGNALNECLAEVLCVRPTDPIEYMGHWLYHYSETREYYKKKKSFYENLLATKIDQENRRMNLIQKHNEAIIDITAPILRRHQKSVEATKAVSSAAESAPETGAQKSASAGSKLTTTEATTGHESDISDNSSHSRSQSRTRSLSTGSRAKVEFVVKRLQDIHATSEKARAWKALKNKVPSLGVSPASRTRRPKTLTSTSKEVEDDDDSPSTSTETLLNTHYLETRQSRMSIEAEPAKWKMRGNQVVCFHPVLGEMSIQWGRNIKVQPIVAGEDFQPESMYDHELYSFDYELDSFDHEVSSYDLEPTEGSMSGYFVSASESDAEATDIVDVRYFE
ncbi:hypothetical protein BsWGS_26551 [Bradybaena similaris]